jgi:hypothetical protein
VRALVASSGAGVSVCNVKDVTAAAKRAMFRSA